MRLIDADKIVHEAEQGILLASRILPNNQRKAIFLSLLKLFRADVKDAQEVDAVPVKHGQWIREGHGYCRCSVCNKEFEEDFLYYERKKPIYCPEYGAKMDGGNENA
ncbi:MAG: hypothetical protein K2J39_12750 [Ruminococcus sp.]|nr:hypothetical protein [Ruminococcus sp.]